MGASSINFSNTTIEFSTWQNGAGEVCIDSGYIYMLSNAGDADWWRFCLMGSKPTTHHLEDGEYGDQIKGTVWISNSSDIPTGWHRAYILYRNNSEY